MGEYWQEKSTLWWIRVVPVAVLAADLSILVVDDELGALVVTDPAARVYGVLLCAIVPTTAARAAPLDIPSTIGVGYYMM
jgi:hypothetical protein